MTTDGRISGQVPDLFEAGTVADPFDAYTRLRALGPVFDDTNGMWILARHADVLGALHQPTLFSSTGGYQSLMSGTVGPAARRGRGDALGLDQVLGTRVLIASDPPDHALLRRLVSRGFTKRAMRVWEERARELATELIDSLIDRAAAGDADLVRDVAVPLPVTLIAEILDVPASMMDDFRRWSEALVGGLGGDLDLDRSRAEITDMFMFFSEVAERRRREPGDDLVSAIAVAEPDGRQLEPIEVVMFCILLLVAGNETTTNLIGNHQEALWDHPNQAVLLRERPELVDTAIEEALRYCGTVQGLFRRTTDACTVGGVDMPGDADVLVLFAAANRDENVFSDADRYWLERPNLDHVAFGHGIHYCLGAQLARLEVRAVLEALLTAGIQLEPAGTPQRTMNPVLRGFTHLPVGVTR